MLSLGTATVEGYDIRRDMGAVYGLMGVCPQHDLLWDQLTASEHLLFYGRLKNLKVCQQTVSSQFKMSTAAVRRIMIQSFCLHFKCFLASRFLTYTLVHVSFDTGLMEQLQFKESINNISVYKITSKIMHPYLN